MLCIKKKKLKSLFILILSLLKIDNKKVILINSKKIKKSKILNKKIKLKILFFFFKFHLNYFCYKKYLKKKFLYILYFFKERLLKVEKFK
jgi:hypothetical protein